MRNSRLGRVILGLSVVTIIVLLLFAAITLMLPLQYNIGTQTAYANQGEPTPTPTATPDPSPPSGLSLDTEYINPVILSNSMDPHVLLYNGVYYCFLGKTIHTSTDLVHWKQEDLEVLASGTAGANAINYAGEAFIYQNEFYFVYHYNMTPQWGGEYIGLAKSTGGPLGPYQDVQAPLFNFTDKVSDPCVFIDLSEADQNYPDGKPYMYFNSWDSAIHDYRIYGVLLPYDLKPISQTIYPTQLLTQTLTYENMDGLRVMEGSEVIKRGSIYYLTYSSNGFGSQYYCISAATSTNPLGPFAKYGAPFLERNPSQNVYSTGHHSFTYSNDGSQLYIVYVANQIPDSIYGKTTRIDKINFDTSVSPARIYAPDGATAIALSSPPSTHGTANDKFNGSLLNRGIWKIINEDSQSWSLTQNSGFLTIKSQDDTLYNERNVFKNIFLQDSPPGDFLVTTKVDMPAQYNYEQAGLVIWKDMDNYYKFSRGYWNREAINVDKEVNGTQSTVYKTSSYPYSGTSVYLQTMVMGDEIFSFHSYDGLNYTQIPETVRMKLDTRKIGLMTTRDHSPVERNAKFDFIMYHKDRVKNGWEYSLAGSWTTGHSFDQVNDHRDSTYWETVKIAPLGDAWVGVDLGSAQTVSTICIKWGVDYSDNIGICLGDSLENQSTWIGVASATNLSGGNTIIKFPPCSGKCVIVYMSPNSSHPGDKYAIRSISVYGEDY